MHQWKVPRKVQLQKNVDMQKEVNESLGSKITTTKVTYNEKLTHLIEVVYKT